jgi:hypothetical protein
MPPLDRAGYSFLSCGGAAQARWNPQALQPEDIDLAQRSDSSLERNRFQAGDEPGPGWAGFVQLGRTIAGRRPTRVLSGADAAGIIKGALFRQVPKGGERVGDRLGGQAWPGILRRHQGRHCRCRARRVEVWQSLDAVGQDLDGGEERRQLLEDKGNIPAQEL